MDKKSLSERDICSKYIAPAVRQAGWDMHKQVREEKVSFTKGGIIARGKLHSPDEPGQRYCQWKGPTLCDRLKARLNRLSQLNEQLANTLVEQAVA
ncbi:hypothetical protein DBR00_07360 [Pseudomonas sp. HMWF032]|uniref:hypothetical protein n=1 Tax=Pseudomonas sp. HMWF032 TaxID=2056866 RepID=UPI000D3709EC|nr:hypothetical protein [Pseudomonas sp. HMWF032]PTS85579.1 hypothetical protein DBR00_07360 [Pseudomonas sp. HMWF032]PTT84622.1 hypothetical protein DBR41_06910 [Pseudomonas sp. HMWF010]